MSPLRQWRAVLVFPLDRRKKNLHAQITAAIIREIYKGHLLPGTRELARHLQVHRNTVIQAYDSLKASGLLESETRKGTFVAAPATAPVFERNKRAKPFTFNHFDNKIVSAEPPPGMLLHE